jgi:hypothetical protein
LCKITKEVAIFIGGDEGDNEAVLANVLEIFEEVLLSLTKGSLTRRNLLENYQGLLVAIDEMIDDGIIINTDAENLDIKVNNKSQKAAGSNESASSGILGTNQGSTTGGYFSSVIFYL